MFLNYVRNTTKAQGRLEPAVRIELTTHGLQNRCSTAELSWLPVSFLRAACDLASQRVNLIRVWSAAVVVDPAAATVGKAAARNYRRLNQGPFGTIPFLSPFIDPFMPLPGSRGLS